MAPPATKAESHVTQIPRLTRSSAQDPAIHQRSSTNPGAERHQNDVATSASCPPKHFGNQRGARVIFGTYGQITGSDGLAQQLPFQKVQVSRQALYAR